MITGFKDRLGKEIETGDIVLVGELRGRNARLYSVRWDAIKNDFSLDDVVWNHKSVSGYFRLVGGEDLEVVGKLI